MRNQKQQKNFDKLVNLLDGEDDLEELMSKTYIKYLQTKLIEDFEAVIGTRTHLKQINTTDEQKYTEYLQQYYHFNLYIHYFEHLEKYDICSTIKNILELMRYQYIKMITNDVPQSKEGWDLVFDTAEDELNEIIKNEYGTNF
jgi:hypothetical protein